MRVLVACEMSGRVREAFRNKGHDAYSVDLLPSLDDSPYHFVGDCLDYLDNDWDLLIGHPPCTYLCNSGVRWLTPQVEYTLNWNADESLETRKEEMRLFERWTNLSLANTFFLELWNAPVPKIILENPVPHKYAKLPRYSQTIQPYQFGDDASKRTCLWLKGLEKLSIPPEDSWVQPRTVDGKRRWANQTDSGQNKETPSEDRGMKRSLTYQGIANALSQQYG